MDVAIRRIRDSVEIPRYATEGSVAFDLCTAEPVEILPGRIGRVGTGLVVATPPGWALLVCLRSSTPQRFGVIQPHAIGIIDQDYRGAADEMQLQLLNYTTAPANIPAGARIAQGLFVPTERAHWTPLDVEPASRGGFGSTDAD
jgi:dUTP pyrophosphatase